MNVVSLLLLAVLICFQAGDISAKESRSELLSELEEVLSRKDVYEGYFNDRLNVMKSILAEQDDLQQRYNINKRLADEYFAHSMDSTVRYIDECRKIALQTDDGQKLIETDILLAWAYTMAGYHIEAASIVEKYHDESIPADLRPLWYEMMHDFHGELQAYARDGEAYQKHIAGRDKYRNLLLSCIPTESFLWHRMKSEECISAHDFTGARNHISAMVGMSDKNTNDYAIACYLYFDSLISDKDSTGATGDEQFYWLVRSAVADIMCATRDYASLNFISRIVFDSGDVTRAFGYIADYCLPDAISFGGKLRPWQVAQFFPTIENAYESKSEKDRTLLCVMLGIVAVLMFCLLITLLFISKKQRILLDIKNRLQESYLKIESQNHDLIVMNDKLSSLNANIIEAGKIKQDYIAAFLCVFSENIDKERQYKNHVLKYIRQGNSKEIANEIEALSTVEEDIDKFYKMFDRMVTAICPDFVSRFNDLLMEGEEIYPKGDNLLAPEMRIFALINFGITDAGKIASLLHYSTNTIYNYRAKIKNKAKGSRDEFEEAIKNFKI